MDNAQFFTQDFDPIRLNYAVQYRGITGVWVYASGYTSETLEGAKSVLALFKKQYRFVETRLVRQTITTEVVT